MDLGGKEEDCQVLDDCRVLYQSGGEAQAQSDKTESEL
jgi:hypothetical protein